LKICFYMSFTIMKVIPTLMSVNFRSNKFRVLKDNGERDTVKEK